MILLSLLLRSLPGWWRRGSCVITYADAPSSTPKEFSSNFEIVLSVFSVLFSLLSTVFVYIYIFEQWCNVTEYIYSSRPAVSTTFSYFTFHATFYFYSTTLKWKIFYLFPSLWLLIVSFVWYGMHCCRLNYSRVSTSTTEMINKWTDWQKNCWQKLWWLFM